MNTATNEQRQLERDNNSNLLSPVVAENQSLSKPKKRKRLSLEWVYADKRTGYMSRLYQKARKEWGYFLCSGSIPIIVGTKRRCHDASIRAAVRLFYGQKMSNFCLGEQNVSGLMENGRLSRNNVTGHM